MLGRVVLVAIAGMVVAVLGTQVAQAAPTCQTSGPAGGTYTVSVCLADPASGANLSGKTTVTATVAAVTGTSPGTQRMVFTLNGQYLLTDYQAPYTFTLDTARFVDGSYSLGVRSMLRDTYVTPDTTEPLTFSNGVTTPPTNTKTFTVPQGKPVGTGDTFTVAAAGDGAGGDSAATAVTSLMASQNPNLALYLGDVYEKGTSTEFDNWYGPALSSNPFFGQLRDITMPTVGNHEYENGSAPGYFDYWDNVPHYYSVNRNGWHIISLDANSAFGQTAVGTPQYTWLQNDLQANTQPCTLAFFHEPRFNIGDEGASTYLDPIWSLMASKGVDLVVNGHDHSYQRWTAMDGNGNPSPTGVTEIINGAGGHALGAFPSSDTRVVSKDETHFGALMLGLNSAGASYRFVRVGGTVGDSGSVKCNASTADQVSPGTPTQLVATGTYKTKIDLTWKAATDNVGVTGYRIFRDGTLLDTIGAQESYSDTTVTPGSTHSYTVRALDAAGNVSSASAPATASTPTVAVLFHDGFETGTLASWTNAGVANPVQNGLTVQSAEVDQGQFAARSTINGLTGSAAWHSLSQPENDVYYSVRFKTLTHSTAFNLMRLRAGNASSSAIASVMVSQTNKLTLRNDSGSAPASLTSTASAAPGAWHTLQLHANVSAGTTEAWLDGVAIPEFSVTRDLGLNPVAKIELGDPGSPTTSKTFDVALDEVAVDREFIGDLVAPSAATNLVATPHSGLAVDLAWTAAKDNVGVTGYDVYRNGSLLTSIGAGTSYRDTTVQSNHNYTYQLVAKDAAGNASGFSNSATAQTGDVFSDGFESGDLSRWTSVSGLTVGTTAVDTGTYAARATSDGTAGASAQTTLDAGLDDAYARVRFNLLSRGPNNVNLMRLRNTTNGAMVTVFVTSTGKLGYRNDVTGATTTTTATVGLNTWQEAQVHVTDGDTGQVELWLNGVSAASNPEALGTNPVGRFEIGDTSTARIFDLAMDNVVLSPNFVSDTQAPSAPANLALSGSTTNSATLSWDAASDDIGVTGYRVYRDGVKVAEVDGLTLTATDTGLSDSTTYHYAVRAIDAVGHESVNSNVITMATADGTKPTAPTNVSAKAVAGQNQVAVTWNAATDNTGVTGYKVYRSDLTQPFTPSGTGTSFTDTSVSSGTAYTYKVTALDAAGNESDPSAPATVTSSDTTPPGAPTGVSAAATSDTSARITWNAASDASGIGGYDVYRSGVTNPVGSTNGTTLAFTDTGLTADTAYTWTVVARDSAGNASPPSATGGTTTWVFGDGFETGNTSRWSSNNGLVVQTVEKFSGSYGARAPGTAKATPPIYATKNLPGTSGYTDLYYDVRFELLTGKGSDTDLLRFRTSTGANILGLYYTGNKRLAYINDKSNTTTISTATLPVGAWQEAQVRVRISGATSRVDVWLNGSPVAALTKVDNLGTAPVGQVVAGESTAGRSFDFALDDVRVTRTQ